MANAKSEAAWAHTSSILAMIANVNRNPKKRAKPFTPMDFSPYKRKMANPNIPLTADAVSSLKGLVGGRKGKP